MVLKAIRVDRARLREPLNASDLPVLRVSIARGPILDLEANIKVPAPIIAM
jgi:hypothetical protein